MFLLIAWVKQESTFDFCKADFLVKRKTTRLDIAYGFPEGLNIRLGGRIGKNTGLYVIRKNMYYN